MSDWRGLPLRELAMHEPEERLVSLPRANATRARGSMPSATVPLAWRGGGAGSAALLAMLGALALATLLLWASA